MQTQGRLRAERTDVLPQTQTGAGQGHRRSPAAPSSHESVPTPSGFRSWRRPALPLPVAPNVLQSSGRPSSPIQPHPGPSRPVQPRPGPSSPVQALPGPSSPVQARPAPSRPFQPRPGPSSPVQPRPPPSRPIQALPAPCRPVQPRPGPSTPSRPFQPRPAPSRPVHPRPGPSRPVQPRPGPSSPVQALPALFSPVHPRPGPSSPVQARPAPCRPVQPRPGPSSPVQPRPGPSTPVQARPAPSSPVQARLAPSRPFQPRPAPSSPVPWQRRAKGQGLCERASNSGQNPQAAHERLRCQGSARAGSGLHPFVRTAGLQVTNRSTSGARGVQDRRDQMGRDGGDPARLKTSEGSASTAEQGLKGRGGGVPTSFSEQLSGQPQHRHPLLPRRQTPGPQQPPTARPPEHMGTHCPRRPGRIPAQRESRSDRAGTCCPSRQSCADGRGASAGLTPGRHKPQACPQGHLRRSRPGPPTGVGPPQPHGRVCCTRAAGGSPVPSLLQCRATGG